jgi:hypothetical protein
LTSGAAEVVDQTPNASSTSQPPEPRVGPLPAGINAIVEKMASAVAAPPPPTPNPTRQRCRRACVIKALAVKENGGSSAST